MRPIWEEYASAQAASTSGRPRSIGSTSIAATGGRARSADRRQRSRTGRAGHRCRPPRRGDHGRQRHPPARGRGRRQHLSLTSDCCVHRIAASPSPSGPRRWCSRHSSAAPRGRPNSMPPWRRWTLPTGVRWPRPDRRGRPGRAGARSRSAAERAGWARSTVSTETSSRCDRLSQLATAMASPAGPPWTVLVGDHPRTSMPPTRSSRPSRQQPHWPTRCWRQSTSICSASCATCPGLPPSGCRRSSARTSSTAGTLRTGGRSPRIRTTQASNAFLPHPASTAPEGSASVHAVRQLAAALPPGITIRRTLARRSRHEIVVGSADIPYRSTPRTAG